MPGIWLTQRPFGEITQDLAFIVQRIDPEWFAGARWIQRKDASISRVTLYDWVTLSEIQNPLSVWPLLLWISGRKHVSAHGGFQEQPEMNLYNVRCSDRSEDVVQGEPLLSSQDRSRVCPRRYRHGLLQLRCSAVRTGAMLSERGHFRFNRVGSHIVDSKVHTVVTEDRDTTNTVIIADFSQVIKVYRKLQTGLSPDIEISKGLDKVGFSNIPRPLGYGIYSGQQGVTCPAFFVQEFIENEGDAWGIVCRDALEFLRGQLGDSLPEEGGDGGVSDCSRNLGLREGRLGAVTAGLHWASSSIDEDGFTPNPWGLKM